MDRRLFLRGLTGIIVGAPAIVSASSLMKLVVPKQEIILPEVYGFERFTEQLAELEDSLLERVRTGTYTGHDHERDYFNTWYAENHGNVLQNYMARRRNGTLLTP
jgi:hypothetical protein